MASAWDITTGDGHITLRLPDGFGAELDAHTGDGSLDVGFPISSKGVSNHDIRGRLNDGGPALKVRTGDGSIKVIRN